MGLMTLTELRGEVRFHLFNRPNNADDASDARIDRWIAWTYNHVTNPKVFRHREAQTSYTITLATGVNEYSLSTATVGYTITAVRSVTWFDTTGTPGPTTNKNKLKPKDYNVWFNDRTLTLGGTPHRYALEGGSLFIDPVPSTNENGEKLIVRAYREPVVLADATYTVLPAIWDEVILLGAKWRAERDLGYRERAELAKQDFAAMLSEYREREEIEIEEDFEWMPDLRRGDPVQ